MAKMSVQEAAEKVLSDPNFWDDVAKHIAKMAEEREKWVQERMPDVLAAVKRDVADGRAVNNDPYSTFPPEYTAEDVCNLVHHMISQAKGYNVDCDNPFPNKQVVVDGLEYGEMDGQGTFRWVKWVKKCEGCDAESNQGCPV